MRLAGGIMAEVFGVPMGCRVYQKVRYIPRMAIQREITVKLANSPGTLSRVSQLLGAERINMLAMSIDPSGHLRMVVDNPLHAASTLREQHYNVEERDVLYTVDAERAGLAVAARCGCSARRASTSITRMPAASIACRWSAWSSPSPTRRRRPTSLESRQLRSRNLTSCDCSCPRWTRFSSNSTHDGRVRFDNEDWSTPSVQERRAIIHAAKDQLEHLKELLDVLESEP